MLAATMDSTLSDIEFLARSPYRVSALAALSETSRSRRELQELTEASSSTVGRLLCEFEKRRWVQKNGHRYEATQLGAFVAGGMAELIDRIETERALRDVWGLISADVDGLSIEMVSDATVTVAVAEDPYRPVNRFVTLLEGTERFRFVGFDLALVEPCRDDFRRLIVAGMETEIVDPPGVARYVVSTYREHCSESIESGNLTIRVHDDLPTYGLALFDDRVGISGYDPDSGSVRVLIDTDSREVREWAETTYESYREEARSFGPPDAV
ncbi:helix-turn-helix transcriptional regulator [Natronorarus salvus]|uniref:helix-turn-helix transcriptional regulator n=1 Tax=Natronorarus salvus TaxID=3117733 RepID=UPI002F265E96